MLILAPMHPVMLVYDTDETEGDPLPEKLTNFAKVTGEYKEIWTERLLHNLERDRILVEQKRLRSTNAGFATTRVKSAEHIN